MGAMPEFGLPPCDEPVDFRRQAAFYARFRRDYSPALYAAIEEASGPADGRRAVDLGCGPGLVASTLAARGWRPVGVDFSAPMLAEAAGAGFPLARARAEALPLCDGTAALLTCGTAFHWFAPTPTLAEVARVLAPGGWAALFWRYDVPGQPFVQVIAEALASAGVRAPVLGDGFTVHPTHPFADSELVPAAPQTLESELAFTAESFHGYVATLEWVRRFSGPHHAAVLAYLRAELDRRWPEGFRARVAEYLFLAQKP
jgi:SAM-dependent methyltransferase